MIRITEFFYEQSKKHEYPILVAVDELGNKFIISMDAVQSVFLIPYNDSNDTKELNK